MNYLDTTSDVVTWTYESVVIPYVSNRKTGKIRKYYPDFYVEYVNGDRIIIEIKPSKRVHQAKVAKKLLAASEHCAAHGMTFKVLTEHELKVLGLL